MECLKETERRKSVEEMSKQRGEMVAKGNTRIVLELHVAA